ncbi:MAG: hypothetical protein KDK70_23150 [Myxococcales bacterium]|nr:hypothetical protein [Myxococcales bacterium]
MSMAWNVKWQCALLALVVACSKDDDDGGSETDAVDCDCMLGAYVPACGVDGMTYDATCGLECVPVDVLCMAECPCPEIQCGDRMTCGPQAPVCSEMIGGPAGSPTTYACDPLPAACDGLVPTCACVGSRGCECVEDPPGYFHVTCAAP